MVFIFKKIIIELIILFKIIRAIQDEDILCDDFEKYEFLENKNFKIIDELVQLWNNFENLIKYDKETIENFLNINKIKCLNFYVQFKKTKQEFLCESLGKCKAELKEIEKIRKYIYDNYNFTLYKSSKPLIFKDSITILEIIKNNSRILNKVKELFDKRTFLILIERIKFIYHIYIIKNRLLYIFKKINDTVTKHIIGYIKKNKIIANKPIESIEYKLEFNRILKKKVERFNKKLKQFTLNHEILEFYNNIEFMEILNNFCQCCKKIKKSEKLEIHKMREFLNKNFNFLKCKKRYFIKSFIKIKKIITILENILIDLNKSLKNNDLFKENRVNQITFLNDLIPYLKKKLNEFIDNYNYWTLKSKLVNDRIVIIKNMEKTKSDYCYQRCYYNLIKEYFYWYEKKFLLIEKINFLENIVLKSLISNNILIFLNLNQKTDNHK